MHFHRSNRLLVAKKYDRAVNKLLAKTNTKSWVKLRAIAAVTAITIFNNAIASATLQPKWVVMGKNLAGETLSLDINSPVYTKPKPFNGSASAANIPTGNPLGDTTFTYNVLSRAGTRTYNAGTSSCNKNQSKIYTTSFYRESWTVFNLGQFQTIPANSEASKQMLATVCKKVWNDAAK